MLDNIYSSWIENAQRNVSFRIDSSLTNENAGKGSPTNQWAWTREAIWKSRMRVFYSSDIYPVR